MDHRKAQGSAACKYDLLFLNGRFIFPFLCPLFHSTLDNGRCECDDDNSTSKDETEFVQTGCAEASGHMAQSTPVNLEAQAQAGSAEASAHMAQSTPANFEAQAVSSMTRASTWRY